MCRTFDRRGQPYPELDFYQAFSSRTRTSPFSSSTISLYSIGSRPPESAPELGRAPVPMPPARGPVNRGASGIRSRGNGEGILRVKKTCRLVLVAMHMKMVSQSMNGCRLSMKQSMTYPTSQLYSWIWNRRLAFQVDCCENLVERLSGECAGEKQRWLEEFSAGSSK